MCFVCQFDAVFLEIFLPCFVCVLEVAYRLLIHLLLGAISFRASLCRVMLLFPRGFVALLFKKVRLEQQELAQVETVREPDLRRVFVQTTQAG